MNIEHFSKLISEAMLGQSPEQRSQAEKSLLEFKESQGVQFVLLGVQILTSNQIDSQIKYSSAILIKRALSMNEGDKLWDSLNNKQEVKDMLLGNLISKDYQVLKGTADCIAVICSIELPRKQWPNIIQVLVNQTNNQEVDIKKAAILTLGYICEKIKDKQNQTAILDEEQVKQILTGILMSIRKEQQNQEIRFMGIQALQDSLQFMKNMFQQHEIINFMIESVVFCISDNQPSKIKQKGIQVLIDFTKLYVNLLPNYIAYISNVMKQYLELDDFEISSLAIEFYNTVCQEQKEKNLLNLQLSQQFANDIVPVLLRNLLKQLEDDDENNINYSSENTLCSIMEINGDSQINTFTIFIQTTINSEQLQQKVASMMAFNSLLSSNGDQNNLTSIIRQGLPNICQALLNSNDLLAYSASQCIAKVCELHSSCIFDHNDFQSIIICINNSLQRSYKISRSICWCYNLLSEQFQNISDEHQIFKELDQIIQLLLGNAQRPNLSTHDISIIDVSYLAIMNILHNTKSQQIQQKYLQIMVNIYEQLKQASPSIIGYQNQKGGVLACLHQSVNQQEQLNVQTSKMIYQLVIDDFQKMRDVHADGLYVISALANILDTQFSEYVQDSFQYIKHGLQKTNEPDLFKTSLGTLSDICRSCSQAIEPLIEEVIPQLLQLISTQNIDKQIKLHIFNCLGDIALNCQKTVNKYLDQIIQIYNLGFSAAISLQSNADQDSQDYSEQLKDHLIESYVCFLHAMQDVPESKTKILSHVQTVVQFIEKSCAPNLNPTVDYIRNCLTLISDIGNFYKDQVTYYVKTQFAQQLIINLSKFANDKENKDCVQFAVSTLQKLK